MDKLAFMLSMTTLNATMSQMHMGNLATKAEPATKGVRISDSTASKPNADSDEKLLLDVGNYQSREAFNELFERFSSRIFAHGMKITRNEQLSKDLVQEAMMTVWQKAPLYNSDRGNVQSWIFTLTRNRCFDMLRKQKRQPMCVSADDIWPAGMEDSETLVEKDQGSLAVEFSNIERFLIQLPDAQQAVVEKVYLLNLTHEEAAADLEIPLGTLKSRLRLAMGKLRQLIGTS